MIAIISNSSNISLPGRAFNATRILKKFYMKIPLYIYICLYVLLSVFFWLCAHVCRNKMEYVFWKNMCICLWSSNFYFHFMFVLPFSHFFAFVNIHTCTHTYIYMNQHTQSSCKVRIVAHKQMYLLSKVISFRFSDAWIFKFYFLEYEICCKS